MPTYGYRCTVCTQTFERFQKITDPAVTECESCGQPVKKILYPVGIQFKGSGFYVNDYSKSGGSKPKSGDDAPSETKADSAAAATDTKTETPAASPSAPAVSDSKTAPAPTSAS